MIVIYAHINNPSEFTRSETDKFRKELKALKVDRFVQINTVPKLLEALDVSKEKEVLLFANFSPNDHFKKNGGSIDNYQKMQLLNWEIGEYSISAGIYHYICTTYSLIAIHFITGAQKAFLKDSNIKSITGEVPVTIKRKKDWLKPGMNFHIFLKLYLKEKIKHSI